MMKIVSLYFFIFTMFFGWNISAQQNSVISISEEDQDGNSFDKNGNIKESYKNTKIVDINSVLHIDLDKDVLISKSGKAMEARLPDHLSKKLSSLIQIMESRQESLITLERIVNSYNYQTFKTDVNSYNTYISELQKTVEHIEKIIEIDPRIEEKALKYDDMYGSVYLAATEVIQEVRNEITEFAKSEGVSVQMGSWLVTNKKRTPLHLPGFDSIAPQKPYEVERWQFIPTEEQLSELERLQELARENRGKEKEILKAIARNHIAQLEEFGNTKIKELKVALKQETEKIKAALGATINPKLIALLKDIEETERLTTLFISNLSTRKEYYEGIISGDKFTIEELVVHLRNDIQFITEKDGKELLNQITKTGDHITSLDAVFTETLSTLKTLYEDLKTRYTEFYNVSKNAITESIQHFLYGQKLDFAALNFSDKVYKLSLDALPEATSFNLIDAGIRDSGDQLGFKLVVSSKKGVLYEENRRVFIFKILPHVEGTVGVIFADPLAHTGVKTQFQMAPYYNMIIKGVFDQGIRRKSIVYNRLLDWGVGLHISAPDFDGDDVPELGVGIVVSVLHDYVQSGMAINVFTGDPYWFFGLRLPVPSFNIGGIPALP